MTELSDHQENVDDSNRVTRYYYYGCTSALWYHLTTTPLLPWCTSYWRGTRIFLPVDSCSSWPHLERIFKTILVENPAIVIYSEYGRGGGGIPQSKKKMHVAALSQITNIPKLPFSKSRDRVEAIWVRPSMFWAKFEFPLPKISALRCSPPKLCDFFWEKFTTMSPTRWNGTRGKEILPHPKQNQLGENESHKAELDKFPNYDEEKVRN